MALEYAHEKGVVHRDLKSANVKITSEGPVKVLPGTDDARAPFWPPDSRFVGFFSPVERTFRNRVVRHSPETVWVHAFRHAVPWFEKREDFAGVAYKPNQPTLMQAAQP